MIPRPTISLTARHLDQLMRGKRIRVPVRLGPKTIYLVMIDVAAETFDPVEAAEFLPPREMRGYRRWIKERS
jgi:hypothetical protein